MQKRRCRACRKTIEPRARTPDQGYCNDERCQKERRRRWQKEKRQSDADYRDNDRRAQRDWAERNPEYWKEYRRAHPEYAERNRQRQLERDRRRRDVSEAAPAERVLANEDASAPVLPSASVTYEQKPGEPAKSTVLANEDVRRVKTALLPGC